MLQKIFAGLLLTPLRWFLFFKMFLGHKLCRKVKKKFNHGHNLLSHNQKPDRKWKNPCSQPDIYATAIIRNPF
jgi:hypothetical protein